MCFYISDSQREKLVKRFQRNNGVLYLWKRISYDNLSIYYSHIWHVGVNRRDGGKTVIKCFGQASHGIYVYTTRKYARLHYLNGKLIRVRCLLKDLLYTDGISATFKKVYVEKL